MIKLLGLLCVGLALFLDTLSYYRQIKKTIRMKKASQVSSTSFVYKILKAFCSTIGLVIYMNWVGFSMELFMLLVYIISLSIIIRYKPKNWHLFEWKYLQRKKNK